MVKLEYMETPKFTQKISSLENKAITREEAINALKADPESPATIEIFKKWYDQEYDKLVKAGERDPYPLDWSVAELYIEAEQYELAYNKLNDLADTAWEARDDAWVEKANAKIDEINNRNK